MLTSTLRRALGDCSNNGVTARNATPILFVFDNYTEMEHLGDKGCAMRDEAIAYCHENGLNPELQLILVKRILWGEKHYYAAPLVRREGGTYMASGNYVHSSDSRFARWTDCEHPIPCHDRFETWEEYNFLST